MALQGKCQVWLLVCAFCIVFFFETTEGTQGKKGDHGLLGSKGERGQQVLRGFGQLEKMKGREGDDEQRMKEQEVDHYSNVEMLLRKGTLEQNNSVVGDDDNMENVIGYTASEPDFDLSLGSWFENLLYSDYEDESQDISSHEHDDTHSGHSGDNYEGQEMGHKHHSHSVSERGQEERHSDEDHSDKRKQKPTSSHAASVSMATWLVSFSSITVISVVRSFNTLMLSNIVAIIFAFGFIFSTRLVWRPWAQCPFCRADIANPCFPC